MRNFECTRVSVFSFYVLLARSRTRGFEELGIVCMMATMLAYDNNDKWPLDLLVNVYLK